MGAQVGCDGEVTIQSRRPQLLLHPGQIWRLPSNQRDSLLPKIISPSWKSALVYMQVVSSSGAPRTRIQSSHPARGIHSFPFPKDAVARPLVHVYHSVILTVIDTPQPRIRGIVDLGDRRRRRWRGIASRAAHGRDSQVMSGRWGLGLSLIGGALAGLRRSTLRFKGEKSVG